MMQKRNIWLPLLASQSWTIMAQARREAEGKDAGQPDPPATVMMEPLLNKRSPHITTYARKESWEHFMVWAEPGKGYG